MYYTNLVVGDEYFRKEWVRVLKSSHPLGDWVFQIPCSKAASSERKAQLASMALIPLRMRFWSYFFSEVAMTGGILCIEQQ